MLLRYFWIHGTLSADKNFDDDGEQQQHYCLPEVEQQQQQEQEQEQQLQVLVLASLASPTPTALASAPVTPNSSAAQPSAPGAAALDSLGAAAASDSLEAAAATTVALCAAPPLLVLAPPAQGGVTEVSVAVPGLAAAPPAPEAAPEASDSLRTAATVVALSAEPLSLVPALPAPGGILLGVSVAVTGLAAAPPALQGVPAASDSIQVVAALGPMQHMLEEQQTFTGMDPNEEKAELDFLEEKENDIELTEDQELQHPPAIYIPNQQLKAEKTIADTVVVVHSSKNNESFPLMVSGTCFNLSSFHFASENTSIPLYNNSTNLKRSRLEYIDFSRPQLHLYMWDRRHAVTLSVQSPVSGRYQTRFYLAMTNLFMPQDEKGESVYEDLVLLDLLYRLDPYAYIDAVVGVVATGEVILWQHSLNHLRFNYCDFHRPLKRGEAFWFSKLEQFYSAKGLLYLRQRLIPRDLDAPRNRFAITKEYITHYKHPCKTLAKVDDNFKKWLLLPGKNKSKEEQTQDLVALLTRCSKGKNCSIEPLPEEDKTLAQIEQEEYAVKQKAKSDKRKATIQANKEAAAAIAATTAAAATAAAATAANATAANATATNARGGITANVTAFSAGRTAGDSATRVNAGTTACTKLSGRGQIQVNLNVLLFSSLPFLINCIIEGYYLYF